MASNVTSTKKAAKITEISRKTTTKQSAHKHVGQPSPEETAWNMPLGIAMDAVFSTATPKDFRLSSAMYKALCETMEQAPKGATSKHFYMAALNFAHSAILRRCEETSQ